MRPPQGPLSRLEKLLSVVQELLLTERSYVRSLCTLYDRFIGPLILEPFLNRRDKQALLSNLPKLVRFQQKFLTVLEAAIRSSPCNLTSVSSVVLFEGPDESLLHDMLIMVADVFVNHMPDFKLYSEWCANYSTAMLIIGENSTIQLKEFVDARTPAGEQAWNLQVCICVLFIFLH